MVKSANTNGLLDNDCDSSKYQTLKRLVSLTHDNHVTTIGNQEKDNAKKGYGVEHEYYESFYRNLTDNIKLSNFKDRWMNEICTNDLQKLLILKIEFSLTNIINKHHVYFLLK